MATAPAARPGARPAPVSTPAAAKALAAKKAAEAAAAAAAAEAEAAAAAEAEEAAGAPADESWEGATATDAEDTPFGGGIIPADGYQVVVSKAYFRTSATSQLDYVNLDLQVVEGEYEGRHVFCPLYINSASDNFRKGQKGFLAKFFEVCLGAIPEVLPSTDEELAELVGQPCWVKVTVEEEADMNDATKLVEKNRVVRARTADEGAAAVEEAPADPKPGAKPAARAAAPAARKPAGKGGGVADMDDDIPF